MLFVCLFVFYQNALLQQPYDTFPITHFCMDFRQVTSAIGRAICFFSLISVQTFNDVNFCTEFECVSTISA